MKKWLFLITFFSISLIFLRYGFFFSPLHHLRWADACPKQTMTPNEIESLYQQGKTATEEGRMGEYYLNDSIRAGLPLLRKAAEHGHREAMDAVSGHLMQAGIINVNSGTEVWRTQIGVAEEAMMWLILRAHLTQEIHDSRDKDIFPILFDPSIPFPDNFFEEKIGIRWYFQMLPQGALDHARKQAFAWRNCWNEP